MSPEIPQNQKAMTLKEIRRAVRFDTPVPSPDDPFFVDFSDVRGDFAERMIYEMLNVDSDDFTYDSSINYFNKTTLFLGGMRGSGKTSELAKYVARLNKPDCFYCVVCNIDIELDTNDIEYMDIVLMQVEQLAKRLHEDKVPADDQAMLVSIHNWFSERVEEINKNIKLSGGIELELGNETPGFLSIFKFAAKLKAGLIGSTENTTKIRTVVRTRFPDFANRFNEFLQTTVLELNRRGLARDILFIVDGSEKIATAAMRRKMIIDESNKIQLIKANTIFALPIELMKERTHLEMFSTVVSFPFVKLRERNGDEVPAAIERFYEFVFKRIDESLFDSRDTVKTAIMYSGGSPRELLRIIQHALIVTANTATTIDHIAIQKAVQRLATEYANNLDIETLETLKQLKENNQRGIPTPFSASLQQCLEKIIVLEYNDGSYKRVHPIIEASDMYQQYVVQSGFLPSSALRPLSI